MDPRGAWLEVASDVRRSQVEQFRTGLVAADDWLPEKSGTIRQVQWLKGHMLLMVI